MQKKAIRLVFNAKYNTHCNKLFKMTKITKVEHLLDKERISLCYNYYYGKNPAAITNLFQESIMNSNLHTRSGTTKKFRIKPSLKKGDVMFDIMNSWNKADPLVHYMKSFNVVKSFLVDQQNTVSECKIKKCESCEFDYGKARRSLGIRTF